MGLLSLVPCHLLCVLPLKSLQSLLSLLMIVQSLEMIAQWTTADQLNCQHFCARVACELAGSVLALLQSLWIVSVCSALSLLLSFHLLHRHCPQQSSRCSCED